MQPGDEQNMNYRECRVELEKLKAEFEVLPTVDNLDMQAAILDRVESLLIRVNQEMSRIKDEAGMD